MTCFRSFLWLVTFRPCQAQQLAVVFPSAAQRYAPRHGGDGAQRRTGTKARERAAGQPAVDCETSGALTPAARSAISAIGSSVTPVTQLTNGQRHESGTECGHWSRLYCAGYYCCICWICSKGEASGSGSRARSTTIDQSSGIGVVSSKAGAVSEASTCTATVSSLSVFPR